MGAGIEFVRNLIKRGVVTRAGTDNLAYPIQQITYSGKVCDTEVIFPFGLHANLSSTNDTLCSIWAVEGQEDYRIAMGYTPGLRPRGLAEGEVVLYHPYSQSQVYFRSNGDIDVTSNDISEDETGGNVNVKITRNMDVEVGVDSNVVITGNAAIEISEGDLTLGVVEGQATIDVKGDVALTVSEGSASVLAEVGDVALTVSEGDASILAEMGDISIEASAGTLNLTGEVVNIEATSGSVSVDSTDNIKLNQNTDISGDLDVSGDSTANDHISGTISGKTHTHGGVESGASSTTGPQ